MRTVIAIILFLSTFSASAITPEELLAKYPSSFPHTMSGQERLTLAEQVMPLIENIDKQEAGRVIEGIAKTAHARRANVAGAVKMLITEGTGALHISRFIRAYDLSHPGCEANVAEAVKSFATENMHIDDIFYILPFVARFNSAHFSEVVATAKLFIAQTKDAGERMEIIRYLARIDADNIPDLMAMAKRLLPKPQAADDIPAVMAALSVFKPAELNDCVEQLAMLIIDGLDRHEAIGLIHAAVKVDPDQRASVLRVAKILMPYAQKEEDEDNPAVAIIRNVADLRLDSDHVAEIIEATQILLTKGWRTELVADILAAFAEVEPGQRVAVATAVKPFITDSTESGWAIAGTIETIAAIDPDKRSDILAKTEIISKTFMEGRMGFEIARFIIPVVKEILPAEWDDTLARTKEIVTRLTNAPLDEYSIRDILLAAVSVHPDHWEKFLEHIQRCITEKMGSYTRTGIIYAVAMADPDQRPDVVARVQEIEEGLIRDNIWPDNFSNVIDAVVKMTTAEWQAFVEYVQGCSTEKMGGHTICGLIHQFTKIDSDQRAGVAEVAQKLITNAMFRCETNTLMQNLAQISSVHGRLLDYCGTIEDVSAVHSALKTVGEASYAEFHADLIRRINDAEETALAGGAAVRIEDLIAESRNVITQRMAAAQPRAFYAGPAFEIHNAVKVMVTMGDQKIVAPMAIEHIVKTLGIERMRLKDAVSEMQDCATTMDKPGDIKRALTEAYGNGDGSFSGENTRLLGMVWPYIKSLSISTQKSWMGMAIDEAYIAYGAKGGLGCSMGIQERLTVTGFLPTLEGIDSRLVAISTLLQNIATADVDPMIEGGASYLSLETQTSILATKDPDAKTIESWIRASVNAYAKNIENFQNPAVLASGMTPAEDLCGHSEIERKLQEYALPLYTNRDYDVFSKWRDRVQQSHTARAIPGATTGAADETL